jgi:DNA-binding Xre family transcriptional regulator
MSTTIDLIHALKKELKAAHMTYADLARHLDMAESSVKRMLSKGDMPLSRIDAICRALGSTLPTWRGAWPTASRCCRR